VRRGGVPSFTSRRRPPARRRVGPRPVGGRGPKIGPPNFLSERSALSYEHAGKIEAQLKSEVADLLRGRKLRIRLIFRTACRSRRNWAARGAIVAEARARIEARAKERYARELAEHEAKLAAREAKVAATGKKPGGKPPQPPTEGPKPSDQINLTDEESRIMPVAGGGFEQCYNAQAAVAAGSMLVVAVDVVQAPNDKQQIEPMLGKMAPYPKNWVKSKRCWRTRVISARRMLRLARRRGSNR
jgi:hypothetical protein